MGINGGLFVVKNIVKDTFFLSQKSVPATKADMGTARDLSDTLAANADRCVGMAANMIGVNKNIIIVNIGFMNMIMFNPVITKKSGEYKTEEGCLSLIGVRPAVRYEKITVEFYDMSWNRQIREYSGRTAQIIQHEIDHLAGIII